MLFNSDTFLFLFFPSVWILWFLSRFGASLITLAWLVVASMAFYAYWDFYSILILISSIGFNFLCGLLIAEASAAKKTRKSKILLIFGIACDVLGLAYFKYASFLIESIIPSLHAFDIHVQISLPLGISFFTFTQIAYLTDLYRRNAPERSPINYALFVSFFPHLLAGPILHHNEMMPQFRRLVTFRRKTLQDGALAQTGTDLSVGLTIFAIGLFKKVVLADSVSSFVTPVFSSGPLSADVLMAAGIGNVSHLSTVDAWIGATAYALQIYFDFSGYSDMAIGIARCFGVKFPLNFNSPYKSASIIDFWRRWHMTLSRFLRDYVYIPIGGNRNGLGRLPNLMITMLLGGLWHGAGWTFIFWGALHGTYLVINHFWRSMVSQLRTRASVWQSRCYVVVASALTFAAVILAWVFFRADTLNDAFRIIVVMVGAGASWGASLYACSPASVCYGGLHQAEWTILFLLAVVFFAPNTQEIMARCMPALDSVSDIAERHPNVLLWKPNLVWSFGIAVLLGLSVSRFGQTSQFLYYRF